MSEKANDEAVSLAEAKTELMEGPDKEEMEALLDDSDPEYDWDTQVSKYPRANKKFQELWSAAKSTLDIDLIQGRLLKHNLDASDRLHLPKFAIAHTVGWILGLGIALCGSDVSAAFKPFEPNRCTTVSMSGLRSLGRYRPFLLFSGEESSQHTAHLRSPSLSRPHNE